MQKHASFDWRLTASRVWGAAFKLKLRMAGPVTGAGPLLSVGQGGVVRRATCSRGAVGSVSDHAEHGLGEQQAATEVGRGNRRRSPREK
jgi:hypothetical protein